MPKFKDITTMITAARSRQIRMTMIIQNFAQLVQVYGKEDAETIRGNCGNILYLLTGELSALEEISKLCGDKIVKVGKDKREETRPLITVTELQRFKMGEVLLLRHRLPPLRTKIPGYFEIDFGWGKNNADVPPAELPSHEQQPIKLFDIREYVKKKKEEKRNELFGGAGNNPFGGGMTPNPFVGGNPFGGANPFGSPSTPSSNPLENINSQQNNNPLAAYGATNTNQSTAPFNPFENSTSPSVSNDDLNIDDMIKKIDERIAELEAEEKKEKEAEENELKASEQKTVEEIKANDNVSLSSNIIMPTDKIDFSSYNNINELSDNKTKETNHDPFDDMIEDLSFDEPIDKLEESNNKVSNQIIQEEFKPVEETKEQVIENNNIYKNKEEIDKIMKQKDISEDDDFFDEFFE